MARSALSALVALASSLTLVAGQTTTTPPNSLPSFEPTPLVSKTFAYTDLPEQVYPASAAIIRGFNYGYNRCNSSTQNQDSLCQTILINNISDFCVWAPPIDNSTISDTEGIEVGFCTKNGHGTRAILPGTFTGLQVLNTQEYIQYVGYIDQSRLNMQANDSGGELDPIGQDYAGNPVGALVFSTSFGNKSSIEQINYWTQFLGDNIIGIKICNPHGTNPAGYCQHTLDRIGLRFNMPNDAKNGTFEVCDSDVMDIPGLYTSGGKTLSYSQPAESLGPITSIPYTPRIPSSSNCQTYQSGQIFTDFASLAPTTTGSSVSRAGSASTTNPTKGSNGAGSVTISLFTSILGIAFSVGFLA